jgi:hypothetical protein
MRLKRLAHQYKEFAADITKLIFFISLNAEIGFLDFKE